MGIPNDWPEAGPIDLARHDLPHGSATAEWWYVNCHFQLADQRPMSLFAAFFRSAIGKHPETGAVQFGHALTWALSDPSSQQYIAESRLDPAAPRIALERLKAGRGSQDARLNRAMTEVLETGNVPLPDRCFTGEVFVNPQRLELDYAGARFEKLENGDYRLALQNLHSPLGISCELTLRPTVDPVRHGEEGVVRGSNAEAMFYYFIPQCALTGSLRWNGVEYAIAKGQGWYDHEFGGDMTGKHTMPKETDGPSTPDNAAWNWASVQLENGQQISAYSLHDARSGDLLSQWASLIGRDGSTRAYQDFRLEPLTWWRSVRTFHEYPVRWHLVVPEAELDVVLTASFPDQEFVTLLSDPSFWEGRCEVAGTGGGHRIQGLGFIERSGFATVRNLDEFFAAVGTMVRESVARILPRHPTFEEARNLIASKEREHYMDGVDINQLSRALIAPIRDIVDRGGKSWRSYAALVCCDAVGGDARKYAAWLAMPELMHVGSLIVDDVQDRASVRRGGPACHMLYGEPLALNAGTSAYFIGQHLLKSNELSQATKLRLYDLYFEALRAGHAGQALDLDGMGALLQDVIVHGGADLLEKRVLATHRLKTAAPAGALARMGAIAGGGTERQIEAIGQFFEALGLAFQLIDDVLNLRGFAGELKTPGEDIGNGTVTVPVAKAMSRLPHEDQVWLAATLAEKPRDNPRLIAAVIQKLEACGAIEACVVDARAIVEQAWSVTAPLLQDSMSKVMLRAFGWYVLERHY